MGGARGSADGRVLRGRRNKESVVEAFLSLIEEGDPKPTARTIAARAGLSRRSVFQHFADIEKIYEAAGRLHLRRMVELLEPLDPTGPLDDRIHGFVRLRAAALELLDPVARSARIREPFSPQLQANRARVVERMREQVRVTFAPELAVVALEDPGRADDVLTALASSASWASWYHLRNDQGLDEAGATRVLTLIMSVLLQYGVSPLPEVPVSG